MEISRRSLLTSTAFGAGFLLVPGLRSAASAQTAKLVIGNYEAPGLYDQAAQEVVTDRDDGYHNDGNLRHYEWWYFDLFTASGLKAAVEPLPLKWSAPMFRKWRTIDGKQATQARRDCHEVTAS